MMLPPWIKKYRYPAGIVTDYERAAWDRLQSYKEWNVAQSTALTEHMRLHPEDFHATITMANVKLLCK